MKIGIIGAGFTGLATALRLTQSGHEVLIFEKDSRPGGLAIGYKKAEWKWSVEEHYHHWFTNDKSVLDLAKEINYPVIIKRPKTSTLINGSIFQLDSPVTLIQFPLLKFMEKARMGAALALLRYNPFWKIFDRYKAQDLLPKMMGKKGYEMIWEPLLKAKFGSLSKVVSLAWFWARVKKRTSSLAYPEGGFLEFAKALEEGIKKKGGNFSYDTDVIELESNGKPKVKFKKNGKFKTERFDKIIVTLPFLLFLKIAINLPVSYKEEFGNIESLGATNLFLRLKEQFLTEGAYWLNVCEPDSPLMAVVEHTNFMDKKYYNNEHLLYIGHYVPRNHPYFSATGKELLKKFDPYLKKLNKNYKENLIGFDLFKAPYAQPVMPVNYGKHIPPFKTPLKNIYLANIDQVYPWDRGTNYAVELGEKIAKLIEK